RNLSGNVYGWRVPSFLRNLGTDGTAHHAGNRHHCSAEKPGYQHRFGRVPALRRWRRGYDFSPGGVHDLFSDSKHIAVVQGGATSMSGVIRTYLKFNVVGIAGVGVQLLVLALLKSGFGVPYLTATVLAVETAVLHNFFWHERWTWIERTKVLPWGYSSRIVRF